MNVDVCIQHVRELGVDDADREVMEVLAAEIERLRAELGEAQVEAGCLQAENDALNEQAITDASELERMQETIDLYKAENAELTEHLRESRAFSEGLANYIKALGEHPHSVAKPGAGE